MELEQLLIRKEEIPILPGDGGYYHGGRFVLPIYPKLLDENVKINPLLANKVFKRAAEDWFADMKKEQKLEKSVKLSVKGKFGKRKVYPFGFEENVNNLPNGFVKSLSVGWYANSIYVELNSHQAVFPAEGAVKFSTEKFKAYCCGRYKSKVWYDMHLFHMHNPGNYKALLFLRNWGILYVNEALKQVFKHGTR